MKVEGRKVEVSDTEAVLWPPMDATAHMCPILSLTHRNSEPKSTAVMTKPGLVEREGRAMGDCSRICG